MTKDQALKADIDRALKAIAEYETENEALKARIKELELLTTWQPIETAPSNVAFDLWIKSALDEYYGRRLVNMCAVNGKWYGNGEIATKYGEYPAYWMPLPKPPAAIGEKA